jgi:hypothetical protein
MGAVLPFVAMAAASTVAGKLFGPKPAKQIAPPPQVQVRQNTAVADALAGRMGSRVNQRTGARGAEAGSGQKTKLGQ